jgi:hypothetical protein
MQKITILFLTFMAASTFGTDDLHQLLTGVWHDQPYFPESECDGILVLLGNGRFGLKDCSRYVDMCQATEAVGRWSLVKQGIRLDIEQEVTYEGRRANETEECYCSFHDLTPETEIHNPPEVKILVRGLLSEDPEFPEDPSTLRWIVSIGGIQYWKVPDAGSSYCGMIRIAGEQCEGSAGE